MTNRQTAHQWLLRWKAQERWSNPIMGWTSTADPLSSLEVMMMMTDNDGDVDDDNHHGLDVHSRPALLTRGDDDDD
jgi:hypothetical protein